MTFTSFMTSPKMLQSWRQSTWRQNRKCTYSFAVAKDRIVVPKLKCGYKASRMYTISTESGRRHRLPNIQDDGQELEVVIT